MIACECEKKNFYSKNQKSREYKTLCLCPLFRRFRLSHSRYGNANTFFFLIFILLTRIDGVILELNHAEMFMFYHNVNKIGNDVIRPIV